MKPQRIPLVLVVATLAILVGSLGGCPPTDNNNNNTGDNLSTLPVTKTSIPVRFDGSLKVGDNLIVFGTGALTGVSYVVPATTLTAATAVPGTPRSVGFAVAGKKILVFDPNAQLSILDTQLAVLGSVPFPKVLIALDTLPSGETNDRLSPVIADGKLAITRNTVADVGNALKVVNVTDLVPTITPLNNLPRGLSVGGQQVAINATDQKVITYAADSFFIYDLTAPTADPREISLASKDGIQGPFAYGNEYILYVAKTTTGNMRLLSLTDGSETPVVLSKNPGNRDRELAVRDGELAYFLSRNAFDQYASTAVSPDIVYRAAFGSLPGTTLTEGGVAGADPTTNTPPWAGYGDDVAIPSSGGYVFTSGHGAIDANAEFLQVSTGGTFQRFADGTGYLAASDVDAGAALVAFKIGTGETTTLGYIVVP